MSSLLQKKKVLDGEHVFELHDTFGFPADLTALIAKGYNLTIDEAGFNKALERQKTVPVKLLPLIRGLGGSKIIGTNGIYRI